MKLAEMRFEITIDAPPREVWRAIVDPQTYRAWTAPFCEGSYFEGGWNEGDRIRFLTPEGQGMHAVVAASRPHEFISIRPVGEIRDGVDLPPEEGMFGGWSHENYTLEARGAGTLMKVELGVPEEFEEFMSDAWPKALQALKTCAEAGRG